MAKSSKDITDVVAKLQSFYPNSEIKVIDGEIHILDKESTIQNNNSLSTRSTTYAPNGGSYRSFKNRCGLLISQI